MIDEKRVTIASAAASGVPDGWRVVRFDEVAQLVNDRVDNPAEAGVERYVGLEHLDPESLKIRRWGAPTDVEAQKLRFQPGDIIFGKRRAYQRKVAVADFEGICSAHAMVLRAREENVVKEFLPFFMQSDTFFDRALSISVGSLSPTINWTTLAVQKFALPPKEEQRGIADILLAADETIYQYNDVVRDTTSLRTSVFHYLLETGSFNEVRMGELWKGSPKSGYSAVSAGEETGHFVLTLSALSRTGYKTGFLKPVRLIPEVEAAKLKKNDLLISRSNTIELVGLAGIFDEKRNDISFPDTMMLVVVDETKVDKRFLVQFLLSEKGRMQMQRIAAGTSASMKKINRVGLSSLLIPLPSLDTQRKIVNRLDACSKSLISAEEQLSNIQKLKAVLVNGIFTQHYKGRFIASVQ